MTNGRLTHTNRLDALRSWFEEGGVVVSERHSFRLTNRLLKTTLASLAKLGVERDQAQVKATNVLAAELRCSEGGVRKIITKELRGGVGNINQWHPGDRAVYVRVDEKTTQPITDGDIRRRGWYSHAVDGIAREMPDRVPELQANLSAYADQVQRGVAIVLGLPAGMRLPSLLLTGKDDGDGAD